MKLSEQEKLTFVKCAEELAELPVELLQAVNKIGKNNPKKIFLEIEDCAMYIKQVKAVIRV